MEDIKFIDELQNEVMKLVLLNKVQSYYHELKDSLQSHKIIGHYIKSKKSADSPSGYSLECLFFDDKLIHWLVIDSMSIKYNSFPINKINLVHYSVKNDKKTPGFREQENIDELKFIINFSGSDQNSIFINSNASEFSKLLEFKNKLLAQI